MSKDRIYSAPLERVGEFEFDDSVADVFPDMIRRSVPGYSSMLSMIAQCASMYAKPHTNIYDLGCYLGAGTLLIRENAVSDSTIHAVDNSSAMITRLQEIVTNQSTKRPDALPEVNLHLADIRHIEVSNASFVVLNLTLQFLAPQDRTPFLKSVAGGMLDGSALLLSEKVCFEDAEQQNLMTDLHHNFKRAHGYSDLEIAQKRTAIENRLIPETMEAHVARLKAIGFKTVAPWFQCFNFASILAVK